MGAGAGAQAKASPEEIAKAVQLASNEELSQVWQSASEETQAKIRRALQELETSSAGGAPSPATASDADAAPAEEAATAAAEGDEDGDEIPSSWGWPQEPYDPTYLRQYVIRYTKTSANEEWDKALAERSVGGTFDDHLAEKAFVNTLLNKEGTGQEKDAKGIDPNAYKKGKWYRFLNAKGDCNMYIHNYTCDITASRPENFAELTAEEKAILKKLGVYVTDLPEHLARIYDQQKRIPIVFASQECCEALKVFAEFAAEWELLDMSCLRRVNPKGLEDSRLAIVNAMKLGKWLCIYLGDHIPDLGEKICISKNRDTFPHALWTHGGVCAEMIKEKIYRDGDKEGGQYVVRDGFRICVVLMYDNLEYVMSSMRKEEMPAKIPNFEHMEQVRCYAEMDIKKILAIESEKKK